MTKKEFLTKEEIRKVMDSAASAFLPPEEYEKLRDNIFSGWHNYEVCQCTDGYYTFFVPMLLNKLDGFYCVSYNRDKGVIKFNAGSLDNCFTVPAAAPIFEEVFGDSISETVENADVKEDEKCSTFSNSEEKMED